MKKEKKAIIENSKKLNSKKQNQKIKISELKNENNFP